MHVSTLHVLLGSDKWVNQIFYFAIRVWSVACTQWTHTIEISCSLFYVLFSQGNSNQTTPETDNSPPRTFRFRSLSSDHNLADLSMFIYRKPQSDQSIDHGSRRVHSDINLADLDTDHSTHHRKSATPHPIDWRVNLHTDSSSLRIPSSRHSPTTPSPRDRELSNLYSPKNRSALSVASSSNLPPSSSWHGARPGAGMKSKFLTVPRSNKSGFSYSKDGSSKFAGRRGAKFRSGNEYRLSTFAEHNYQRRNALPRVEIVSRLMYSHKDITSPYAEANHYNDRVCSLPTTSCRLGKSSSPCPGPPPSPCLSPPSTSVAFSTMYSETLRAILKVWILSLTCNIFTASPYAIREYSIFAILTHTHSKV